jgi:cytochrome c-type biogenesis protein CcmH
LIPFLLLASLMLIAALAFVLVPLLRSRNTDRQLLRKTLTDNASNVAIFRAQKAEIEEDFAGALITVDERDHALQELSMRVASEVKGDAASIDVAPATSNVISRGVWVFATLAVIGIPLSAVLLYATLGSPQLISKGVAPVDASAGKGANPVATNGAAAESPEVSDKQILAMVDSLAEKMQQNPSDPKGWILLARSQNALGRYADAGKAYERAVALLPNDAQVLADYADVTAMIQDGRFDGKPLTLIKQALQIDPNNMKALALAGTAEMRLGNKTQSLKHWQKLKTLVAKDSDDARELDSIIAEVNGASEGKPMLQPAPSAPAPTKSASAPAAATGSSKTTSGSVTISPELATRVAPGDTLFVFARAVNGPKMPLAIVRVPAPKAWPFAFSLDDSMAMAPGMNLSAFPEVTIEARISKSGNAQPQPGDLVGQSAPLKPGATNIGVSISRLLP